MSTTRRLVLVAGASLLMVVQFAGAASATELDDVLNEARDSTYTASRLVVSVWGNQTQVSREFVERADGMEMVRTDKSWSMAGNGKSVSMGDEPSGVTFLVDSRNIESSRYTIVEKEKASHMSRPCRLVDVMEGDDLRARLVVDDRSGAILIQEMYGGNGTLYRRTTLSDFRAYRTYEAPMNGSDVPVEVVMHEDSYLLPEAVAGYELVDAFGAPGGSEQGFFSDGLFSFSLFILDGNTVITGFEEPMVFAAESGVYDMVPTAHEVRLHWKDGANHYVLVGNLPPDHMVEALAELPSPAGQGMWSRFWQSIFG